MRFRSHAKTHKSRFYFTLVNYVAAKIPYITLLREEGYNIESLESGPTAISECKV